MIYFIFSLIIIIILLITFKSCRKLWALKKIAEKFKLAGYTITDAKIKGIDFLAVKDNKKYVIKVVYNFDCAEISVNSKNFWQKNKGAVASRKSGNKIPNVYDLINLDLKSNNLTDFKKVHIIYPNAQSLVHVLNECEIAFITPETKVYGTFFYNFKDLNKII